MSWSIGSIIVAGVAYVYNYVDSEWSWRMPTALQWMFPVSTPSPSAKQSPVF